MKSLQEAAKFAGVPYRTCASWVEKGLLRPEGYVGRQRVQIPWSEKLTRELCMLAKLRGLLSMQELRKAATLLRQRGHNPFSSGSFLVIEGPHGKRRLAKVCEDKSEAIELLGEGKVQRLLIPLIGDPEEGGC